MMLSNVGLVAFHYKSYGTFLILKKPYNSTVELPTTEIIEPIKEDDKQFLMQYLYSIEQWTEYELYLFGNTMSILSDADLIFLGRALAERNEFYLSLPQHKKAAQLTFINIILALIERNQLYYTTYFMTRLESMINYQDMFTVVFLTFLKDTLAYLKGETDDVQPMRECIEMVKKLGNPTMAKLLEEHLEQFIK